MTAQRLIGLCIAAASASALAVSALAEDMGWMPVIVTAAAEPQIAPRPGPATIQPGIDWRNLPPLEPRVLDGTTDRRAENAPAPAKAPGAAQPKAAPPPSPPSPALFNSPGAQPQNGARVGGAKTATSALPADARPAQQYCYNIADSARDARFALQKKKLEDLEKELAKRIEQLDAKTKDYQKWLARRDEFSRKAEENLVRIYTRMRPDAASAQLVAMDDETAAAVLSKLDPRRSSAILNEMDAKEAAQLSAVMAASANKYLPKKPRAKGPAPVEAAPPPAGEAVPVESPAEEPATAEASEAKS